MIFTMVMVFGIYLNPGLITHMEDRKQGCVVEFLAQRYSYDHVFYGHTCAEVHTEIAKQMEKL